MTFFKVYYSYVDKLLLFLNQNILKNLFGLTDSSRAKILSFFELTLKYGIVSIICGLIELIVFLILFEIFSNTLFVSHLSGFILATFFGYYSHSIYTFDLGKLRLLVLLKFSLQILFVFFLGYYLLQLFISTGFSPFASKLFQLILIFLLNISISKFFTFTNK